MPLNPLLIRYRRMAGPILSTWLTPKEIELYHREKEYGRWVKVAHDRWMGTISLAMFGFAVVSCGLLLALAYYLAGQPVEGPA